MNKLNAAPGDGKTFLTAADVREYNTNEESRNVTKYQRKPDYKFWLDFDFYSRDNDLFHHQDFYPFFGGKSAPNQRANRALRVFSIE